MAEFVWFRCSLGDLSKNTIKIRCYIGKLQGNLKHMGYKNKIKFIKQTQDLHKLVFKF